MNHNRETYKAKSIVAAIFMSLTLLWLTVSIPFVNAAQQHQEAQAKTSHNHPDAEDSSCNPFGNTAEEKAESGSSSVSEYLHHINELTDLSGSLHKHNCSHSFSVYVAFHGELLCPPPNFIRS
jgi:hypothetical protein